MKLRGSLAAVALTLTLVSCSSQNNAPQVTVEGASSALRWVVYLLNNGGMESRPAALLGTYATSFLASGYSLSRTALIGAEQQIILFFEKNQQENESYQLLQDFGNALAVDIPDFLNRSPDRSASLTQYTDALKAYQAAAQRQQDVLKERQKEAQNKRRELTKELSALERDQDRAVRQKDYVTAGSLQDAISDKSQEVAEADTEEKQLRDTDYLYTQALRLADTRLTAMEANREVLIAGVKIVDVPGIANIGILKDAKSTDRLRNNGNGYFDGL